MRRFSVLFLLLAACQPGGIKIEGGDDTAPVEGDVDGDGYAGVDAGGADCDDADAAVYPGAPETWYDDVDQDCSGTSDHDQDGDGVDASPVGGDCDDLDPAVLPGATEALDAIDNDCDGLVDEDFLTAGVVIVTEVMHAPLAASDADAEWFELTNTSSADIDLNGWTITADDGDAITIAGTLSVNAGESVVLGVNGDPARNGGVTVDYVYDRAQLSLSADDTLFVQVGGTTVFDIEWTTSWSVPDGHSISLDGDHLAVADARQSAYWCAASSELSGGDHGTPGSPNDDCTNLDEDGDGYSVDAGDCDDDDPNVSPGRADTWDGVDNDCSGAADDGDAGDAAIGYVDGETNTYLGVHASLDAGDVTGDGRADLVVGSILANTYRGAVYVIDGTGIEGLDADAADAATASVTGSTYSYFAAASLGDVDGDGVADLVVGGGGYGSGGSASTALGAFVGGAGLTGALEADDADYAVSSSSTSGAGYGNNRVLARLDMDGDGLAELVYGQPNASESGYTGKGQVAIVDGSLLGDDVAVADADTILAGDDNQDYLGLGLGGADVDLDGYDDLYVGAIGQDDYATNGGCWYQIQGRATAYGSLEVDAAEAKTISGATASGLVGFGAPAFGDFNGDELVDLAFGGGASATVWVFYGIDGTTSNLDTSDADLAITGDTGFGFAVAAGDFDGDRRDDLAVGEPGTSLSITTAYYWYSTPGSGPGALYLFDGRDLRSGSATTADARASAAGESSGDLFGALIGTPADFDGDGAQELVVAAPRHGGTRGRAYVFTGR